MSAPESPFEHLRTLPGIETLSLPGEVTTNLNRIAREGADAPTHAVFTGPAASGKTTAARALAGEIDAPLVRVDLAAVTSPYIGETEKNLHRVLTAAETEGAVLLFDEADALFGVAATADPVSRQRVADLLSAHPGLVIIESRQRIELPIGHRGRFRLVEFPPREVTPADPAIAGIDTGRTAFVGAAVEGPFDEPRSIISTLDYVATFGAPSAVRSTAHRFCVADSG